ncbi:efflux RND transporter permease subunit, partial [Acinetobacter baumannii]
MMENIFKHLSDHEDHAKLTSAENADHAEQDRQGMAVRIMKAAREVGRPVFFAVLIIIVVFTPLFALEGVEGKMFQPMAIS